MKYFKTNKYGPFRWVWPIGCVLILAYIALPNQGPLVLLDEFTRVLILLGLTVAFTAGTVWALKSKKTKKVYKLTDHWLCRTFFLWGCAVIFCALSIGSIVHFTQDVVQGPQTILLEDCCVSRSRGRKTNSYWLKGTTDDGEYISFQISKNEYYRLDEIHSSWYDDWDITVVGYPHTGRVIELRKTAESDVPDLKNNESWR